jgi:hypothetical protein
MQSKVDERYENDEGRSEVSTPVCPIATRVAVISAPNLDVKLLTRQSPCIHNKRTQISLAYMQ